MNNGLSDQVVIPLDIDLASFSKGGLSSVTQTIPRIVGSPFCFQSTSQCHSVGTLPNICLW